ncbi:AbrB/MazE/SpoVT family DNA-binding domain-containing protein [Candidatus Woesearchaeota archaeon]|nr:AbrB/MazE/SpoVT family DNA-binding domain-containing protein [Candidatus Woesearchaeota archaeon]
MATEIIEMGKISSRGQIAIPSSIREEMGLEEGSKILFLLKDNTIIMKKVIPETFEEITRPFKQAAKKTGFKETEVNALIHKMRKQKHANNR